MLEAVLHSELYGTRGYPGIHIVLLSQRLGSKFAEEEPVDRNAEMSPIESIEEFAANLQPIVLTESEGLIDRQIDQSCPLCAKGIARCAAGVFRSSRAKDTYSIRGVAVPVDVAAEKD